MLVCSNERESFEHSELRGGPQTFSEAAMRWEMQLEMQLEMHRFGSNGSEA